MKGTEAMDQGDIMAAIKLYVQLRSKALFKGHPDLGKSADKLAQCYAFIGKFCKLQMYPHFLLSCNFCLQGNMKSVRKCCESPLPLLNIAMVGAASKLQTSCRNSRWRRAEINVCVMSWQII
jgi:hypothetical protein